MIHTSQFIHHFKVESLKHVELFLINFTILQCFRYISNTANAAVMMSVNFVTFISFFWYFLVSNEIIPLAITPVRDATLSEMLTGRLMNVLNVAMLDIPVAMLKLLEQVSGHVIHSNICSILCISPYTFSLILTTLVTYFELLSDDRRLEGPQEQNWI